jgi:N-acetylated-alpha-linked acidic dipeptidase
MERLAARPHHVGSPYGKENAEFMAGSSAPGATSADRGVPRPLPDAQGAPRRDARAHALHRPPRGAGPPRGRDLRPDREQLPTYNAYSIDGDVTGELVYVNYGVPEDYEELERRGIDVKGKIVHRPLRRLLARHQAQGGGRARRGRLPDLLRPRDDGYFQGDVYPKGGYRPEHGVQRGSVLDMPTYPGDPLTPFVGATADAPRLPRRRRPRS